MEIAGWGDFILDRSLGLCCPGEVGAFCCWGSPICGLIRPVKNSHLLSSLTLRDSINT